MTEAKKRWTAETWIQAAGLVAAVIAVVVTVFFSLRSERNKDLTVLVLAKRPLLSLETPTKSDGMEVRLKGAVVTAPWLVSMRIENSGTLPIEERDIEAPIQVKFVGAKTISSDVPSKSEPAIFAAIKPSEDGVTLQHKLLNPTDWIQVDVLLDGEPKMPPVALARYSGINNPKVEILKPTSDRRMLSAIPLPNPLLLAILSLCTVLSLGILIGGVVLVGQAVGAAFRRRSVGTSTSSTFKLENYPIELRFATRELRPTTHTAKLLYAAAEEPDAMEILLEPQSADRLLRPVNPTILAALGLTHEAAAAALVDGLREGLKKALGRQVFISLPLGADRQAEETILNMDLSKSTVKDLFDHTAALLAGNGDPTKRRIKRDELIGGMSLTLFGVGLVLLLGGTWRSIGL